MTILLLVTRRELPYWWKRGCFRTILGIFPREVKDIIFAWRGAHEMRLNPRQVRLKQTLPLCWVVPSTMQKSPHMATLTSRANSHLMSTLHALMSSCPLHHTKVTLCDHSHLAWQFSSHVHLTCSPPCKHNIFHLAWKNSKKNHAATPFPSIRYLFRATNNKYFYT